MTSVAQLNANRLNAQRSTGPRTEAGKAASRFNALQFGIEARSLVIPGEDPDELAALALEYHQQFDPADALERFLVDTLIHDDWNRRRYTRIEAQVLQLSLTGPDAVASPLEAIAGKAAQMIFRRLASAERSYFRALKELHRAQRERKAREEQAEAVSSPAPGPRPPAPEKAPDDAPEAPANGFVLPIRAQSPQEPKMG
jgi:alkanesulfonate monooxygenase SsuD/methylene tetrahydromethanopterin reductase-like flavin-dependent oxidoreductase (luciferase family)